MFKNQVDDRSDDASREEPLRNFERDDLRRRHSRRPCVEGQQVDSCERIDAVDSYRKNNAEMKIAIGESGPNGRRFEIPKTLQVNDISHVSPSQRKADIGNSYNGVPFLLWPRFNLVPASKTPHIAQLEIDEGKEEVIKDAIGREGVSSKDR